MSKYAYTTLLATDDYLYGVLGLYFSLQNVKTKYDFVLIVTDGVSSETISILDDLKITYKCFPQCDFTMPDTLYKATFNKFHLFQLNEYDKVCFLDGDAVVTSNMDHIFDMPAPGFMVFNDDFLSGVIMLLEPNSQDFNYLLKFRTICGEDESIWNRLYSPKTVTNLIDYENNIIHRSDGGSKAHKYWVFFNIASVEKLKNFMQLESEREFIELRYWMMSGTFNAIFDLDKILLVK